ncbi:MAG: XRE family transcriptional regulator [Anaerolineales bacterium]
MTQAKINPRMLRWARERIGLSIHDTAKKIGLQDKMSRLADWEQGNQFPTLRQAQKLARVLHIPFGYLFLSQPPEMTLPIADFRMTAVDVSGNFSPELEDVLNDAFRKRDWLRERRIQENQSPLPFIGKFTQDASYQVICESIRETLDLPTPSARDVNSSDEHLRFLVKQAEQAGILVLQSGCVGNNTHRTLSVKEFRGFALADSYAPLIFLNAKDSRNGRVFTFAHELGHLWTGTSGVSDPNLSLDEKNVLEIEQLCNQVAAELLVPAQIIESLWKNHNYHELAKKFCVSTLVILIRGYKLGLLPKQQFQTLYAEATKEIYLANEQDTRAPGGDFYRTFQNRNGRLLLNETAQALREGKLLYTEAAHLLNTSINTLDNALQT